VFGAIDSRTFLAPFCGFLALALAGAASNASARSPENWSDRGTGTVSVSELPPAARETLRLVKIGGPFPYAKDGAVFVNRERLLPRKPRGYYREFTVRTPGAHDRGPRRIIVGDDGESYYTDDHYRTFKRILE